MPRPRENDVQTQILDALRFAGFAPLHTSAHRQKGASGVSKGIADILIPIPGLPCYLGWELKRPGKVSWSSQEQKEAHILGQFDLVQSLEDGLSSLRKLEPKLNNPLLSSMVKRFENIARQVEK